MARVANNEWNFIHESIKKKDRVLFGLDGNATKFDDSWTLEDVAVSVGMFPSKGQARKNNFGGPISEGFTHLVKGKAKMDIIILNTGDWMND